MINKEKIPKLVKKYAYVHPQLKTWFFSSKKVARKGSVLMYIVKGYITSEPIQTNDLYPKIDDIVSDIDGIKIKIQSINWC